MAAGPVEPPRFPLADGVRAVAALAVLVHHVGSTTGFDVGNALGAVTARLDAGVAVFFVLSALLLHRPFAAARLHGAAPPSLRRYARRRALRIVPAYWAALLVLGALGWITVFTADWWRYFGFLQVYDTDTALGGLAPAWSLCVEVTFYLALPVWALAANRVLAGRPPREQVRLELAALAVVALAALALRAVAPAGSPLLLTLPAYADWFALGMALAVLSAAGTRVRAGAMAWAGAVAVVAVAAVAFDLPRGFAAPETTAGALALHASYGVGAALLVLPVVGTRAGSLPARVLGHPAALAVGVVSYGVFLYNLPVARELVEAGVPQFTLPLLGTVAGALLLGALSWRLLERPLLHHGARARARRSAAAPPPTRARAAHASKDAG